MTGEPQPFDSVRQHSQARLAARSNHFLTADQWEQHVNGLRDLNILASQASEFQYHRNRTEGKTGLVKPDLIPVVKQVVSPRRLTNEKRQDSGVALTTKLAKPSPRTSPRTSPLRLIAEELPKTPDTERVELAREDTKFTKVGEDATEKVVAKEEPSRIADKPIDPEVVKPIEMKPEVKVPIEKQGHLVDEIPKPEEKIHIEDIQDTKTVEPTSNIQLENAVPVSSPITAKSGDDAKKPVVSSRSDGAARPTLVRSKGSLIASKPPNILVFSESADTRDSVIGTLSTILEQNM